jgi:hypothetical protein
MGGIGWDPRGSQQGTGKTRVKKTNEDGERVKSQRTRRGGGTRVKGRADKECDDNDSPTSPLDVARVYHWGITKWKWQRDCCRTVGPGRVNTASRSWQVDR